MKVELRVCVVSPSSCISIGATGIFHMFYQPTVFALRAQKTHLVCKPPIHGLNLCFRQALNWEVFHNDDPELCVDLSIYIRNEFLNIFKWEIGGNCLCYGDTGGEKDFEPLQNPRLLCAGQAASPMGCLEHVGGLPGFWHSR